MSVRKLVLGSVGLMVLCSMFLFEGKASAQAACNPSSSNYYSCIWWHYQLNQIQRDLWIDNQGYTDAANHIYGGECKVYVQNLVWGVSHGVVWLPQNANDWSWKPDPNVVQVYAPWWGLYKGQIVQMRIQFGSGTYGPHTAVVDGIDLYGVWFIASTGPSAGGDGIVRRYYWTYDYLRAKVGANYSVYDIK